ncbi:MAG TPA: hypothetical protein VK816_09440 [Jatrophihabitantaceae bacterium]|jgi:hypothetical protein|nr:hypothetical protein [Jatrophihabitantaceae bacterium]
MSTRSSGVALRLPVGQKQLHYALYYSRRALARVDNAEVRGARVLLRTLRKAPPDVLYLGDSAVSFVSPDDHDRRRLYRMVADSLGTEITLHPLHGGSYHPSLFAEYVRLIEAADRRPLVVLPLCVRVRTLPWIEHPVFGHKQATEYLRTVRPTTPAWRVHRGFARPTPADFTAFYPLPHATWAGDLTIGDYIHRLKNPTGNGLSDDDRVKLLYAYHHGGVIEQDSIHLEAITRMATTLRKLGCAVVAYQTPVPVETGNQFYGPAFSALIRRNFELMDAAYLRGIGDGGAILQTGMDFRAEEYIDPRDGSEHLNQKGRLRLAAAITTAVRARLDERHGGPGAGSTTPRGAAESPAQR